MFMVIILVMVEPERIQHHDRLDVENAQVLPLVQSWLPGNQFPLGDKRATIHGLRLAIDSAADYDAQEFDLHTYNELLVVNKSETVDKSESSSAL